MSRQPFLEILHPLDADDGPENFLIADGHFRRDAIEDRRPEIEAFFVAWHGRLAAVENELCALLNAFFDPSQDRLPLRLR